MKYKVIKGSNVYTKDPQRFVPDCASITGNVVQIVKRPNQRYCILDAYVAKVGGGYPVQVALPIEDVCMRIGTPISKISTQPETSGYAEWCRISRSWGH